MGPASLPRALGRGPNQILEPCSSISFQGRNVPFREDVIESAVRTTVLVANSHPAVLPTLELADINEFQSSPEAPLG